MGLVTGYAEEDKVEHTYSNQLLPSKSISLLSSVSVICGFNSLKQNENKKNRMGWCLIFTDIFRINAVYRKQPKHFTLNNIQTVTDRKKNLNISVIIFILMSQSLKADLPKLSATTSRMMNSNYLNLRQNPTPVDEQSTTGSVNTRSPTAPSCGSPPLPCSAGTK